MSVRIILLIGLASLITVAGNLMMRGGVLRAGGFSLAFPTLLRDLGQLAHQPLFDCGVLLYGLASLLWFRIVSVADLNSTYPVLVSITFILVTIGATLLFKESLSFQKIAGIAVILAGILLVTTAK